VFSPIAAWRPYAAATVSTIAPRYAQRPNFVPIYITPVIPTVPELISELVGGCDRGACNDPSGIGIRIEDDVLVTPEGHEVMTAAIPKSVAKVEALTTAGADSAD